MSNAVTALGGASFSGLVEVRESDLAGMITIRADLSDAAVIKALSAVAGVPVPGALGIELGEDAGIAWMAPDEALFLCDYADAAAKVAVLEGALGDVHALVVNVSDARAVFELRGAALKDVLGKLTPVDLRGLAPGMIRRSKFAQVPAAFWLTSETEARIVCFRSVAGYMFDLLTTAADADAPVEWHL